MSDETRRRDGIAQTAQKLRESSERAGRPITQAAAEERVRRAVVRGDQIRESGNR